MTAPQPPLASKPARADDWDDEADDWPTPEAREAAKRHNPANDDNPLESLGKAVSAPVIDADAAKASERKP